MAKNGFLGLGGAQGAGGMVRPMPNPRLNPVAQQPAAPARGGFLGPRGSESRHDLAMQFLEMAMNAAPNSGSPILAALAPIAGGFIGARAEKIREDAQAAEVAQMTEAMLGPNGLSPEAREALAILENDNAPTYLKTLAQRQFDAAMAPVMNTGGGGGGRRKSSGRRSSGGKVSSGSVRLFGEYDIGGILHGRTKDGRMVPYTGPDGKPVSVGGGSGAPSPAAPAAPSMPALPADPVLPSDPTGGLASPGGAGSGGLTDDELLKKYGG
jgi:type II secretory pathway pseudopilin PulG